MKTKKILKTLGRKLESGTCTPLEEFNIKMYIGTLIDSTVISRLVEHEIKDQEYLEREEKLKNGIKINRWFDGKHYYAKVFNQDVVDEDGNVKWNSYADAMYATKRFIILNNIN
jgi:hypothetical protein